MEFESTFIDGVFIINNFNSIDTRGEFVKTYNKETFKKFCINFQIKESYYSTSKKNVIRGMHFQLPPNDHQKLVYVPKGAIIDVVLDLRKSSSSYGSYLCVELNDNNKKSIFIPEGLAHGFISLADNTITKYNVSTVYDIISDDGIRYDSFGFDWKINNPIISERDSNFRSFIDFEKINPFK